jgi:hypothetical protein
MDLKAKTVFGFREPMVGVVVDLTKHSKRRASFALLREEVDSRGIFLAKPARVVDGRCFRFRRPAPDD